ncbi:Flavodoxin reductase (ferredoxin-NADPH reductase) family 1 Vanillate O-demethylase oxidoreductase [Candidatus Paraburkholderia kirkii]|nr:Flavodoxin reductase (ferredoxin-NADPH reductase) family 1 Vanillate O-demethylase oxidoreductase [Candidatus Paraburkholderia kirkii]
MLSIGAPRNHFALTQDARRHLLLAGGIGVTPLLCMAEQLAATGRAFEMHYCARSRERTAFVERIRTSAFAARVHFHFGDGAADERLEIERLLASAEEGAHLYVCGPGGFMDAVLNAARALGWPAHRLHYEFFAAQAASTSGDASFQVRLARSAKVVTVPADRTVAEALADEGVDVPVSCGQGICGTCLTRVLDGEPDHRDLYLSPDEQARNDQFTPCCSRAKSRMLVLDLYL